MPLFLPFVGRTTLVPRGAIDLARTRTPCVWTHPLYRPPAAGSLNASNVERPSQAIHNPSLADEASVQRDLTDHRVTCRR